MSRNIPQFNAIRVRSVLTKVLYVPAGIGGLFPLSPALAFSIVKPENVLGTWSLV
jgi:hypothetical protein